MAKEEIEKDTEESVESCPTCGHSLDACVCRDSEDDFEDDSEDESEDDSDF